MRKHQWTKFNFIIKVSQQDPHVCLNLGYVSTTHYCLAVSAFLIYLFIWKKLVFTGTCSIARVPSPRSITRVPSPRFNSCIQLLYSTLHRLQLSIIRANLFNSILAHIAILAILCYTHCAKLLLNPFVLLNVSRTVSTILIAHETR